MNSPGNSSNDKKQGGNYQEWQPDSKSCGVHLQSGEESRNSYDQQNIKNIGTNSIGSHNFRFTIFQSKLQQKQKPAPRGGFLLAIND